MKHLLGGQYIPFGAQYYRAPSPRPEDWESDLKNLAKHGFTMAKFWVQWRWNHPEEHRFLFDDIDRLMDIAHKNTLRVMLNTIVDTAPAWIFKKYPDACMVTLDGRRIGPQTQPHRQIGGLGVCFNHAGAMEYLFKFLETTVDRYKDHPALEIWNIGSEPELTSSIAEIRLYADDAERMRDMLCYCENCLRLFKQWLARKYPSIEKLNTAWNRNYTSFEDVEVPQTRNTFNDMVDWRMFFVSTLGEHVKRRFEVVQRLDGGKHPSMCHHVFIQGFPVTSTANDPWNVGRFGDLHGCTQMDDPMMLDVLRSCARGKPVISAEMLMLFGYTLQPPPLIGANDIKRYVFSGVAANLKGFLFWQYRPEVLGREAPYWGLTHLDGSDTLRLQSFADVNKAIQKNASFLEEAVPAKAEIALLYNPENQIFAWISTGSEKTATDSLLGTHRALYEHNFIVDFVHAQEANETILRQYRVLYLPFPYYLNSEICGALESWVKSGGVLIGEAYFAGWDVERGRHQMVVPGYAMHEVFKARQASVTQQDERGSVTMKTAKDLLHIRKNSDVFGALVQETFSLDGAEVLASFSDGTPAITSAHYGKGKAVLIGSYIGLSYHRKGYQANGDLIAGLVDYAAEIPRPRIAGGSKIRVDTLSSSNGKLMLILRNLEASSVKDSVILPFEVERELTEQFIGERLTMEEAGKESSTARVALGPKEVKVYCA